MSSNRLLAVLAGAGLIAGCAVQNPILNTGLATPTEQYRAMVNSEPHGILLKAGAADLSGAQQSAVTGLVSEWREAGSGVILIEAPRGGGEGARRLSDRVAVALQSNGVRGGQFAIDEYDAPADAPIRVSFLRHHVEPQQCGTLQSDFTATRENKPFSNFGCATTANLAAMVANPADLVAPRAEQPFDAGRRQVVLDKYRAGEPTSSAKDTQADGAISRAVQ